MRRMVSHMVFHASLSSDPIKLDVVIFDDDTDVVYLPPEESALRNITQLLQVRMHRYTRLCVRVCVCVCVCVCCDPRCMLAV